MFLEPTTIILGAGASRPFGLPLSSTLMETIPNSIRMVQARLRDHRHSPREPLSRPGEEGSLVDLVDRNPSRQLLNMLGEFADELERQTQDSIDNFIRENPKHSAIGRLLLLQSIVVQGMYKNDQGRIIRDDHKFSARKTGPNQRNWYHILLNYIRSGAKNAADLSRNNLTIVTFNYDQSLEIFLDQRFKQAEIFSDANWRDVITIYHVYGTPAELPRELQDPMIYLETHKDDIYLIDSERSTAVKDNRDRIKKAVKESAHVFVLGFQLEPTNVDQIGLRDHPNKANVHCLNFDGNGAVKRRLDRLGVGSQTVTAGTADRPLQIDTALSQGFLAYAVE